MPRYSTASGSEDSDFPSQLGPASAGARQLHSTPRFQLPFNNDPNARHGGPNADGQDDSEEEGAWDEVDIPNEPGDSTNHQSTASMANGEPPEKGLEIVISRTGNTQQTKNGKRKSTALTPQERQLRQERHKVHILSLLAMGLVRNRWLNDRELQARLISQVPSHLHAALVSITREKYPNPRDRSRLFEACLKDLTSWWYQAFEIVPARELGRKAIAEIEEELNSWQEEWDRLRKKEQKAKSKGKEKEAQPLEGSRYKRFPWEEPEQLSFEKRKKRLVAQEKQQTPSASTSKSTGVPTSTPTPLVRAYNSSPRAWEPISSIATLYAAAANLRGSKDLSAQLFVALLRGLDVPARLVVSLQGMEWRSDSAAGMTKKDAAVEQKQSKSRTKGKGKAAVETIELTSSDSERDATGWEDGRGTLKYKIPKPNLRRSGPSQKKMANWQKEKLLMRSPSPDPEEVLVPPTQWPEAYSRYLKEWITLDPTRKLVRCKSKMEPTAKAKGSGNALVYVVGFEEDGSAHDVTPRYSKSYNNTTVKLRVPTSTKAKKDNGGKDWFGTILRPWERKYQLNRDKVEDEELWQRSRNEPFPTSFGGFKNHPNYVLEQHLHRDEALVEGTKALGLFKATTPVFPRSAVLVVKSTENWYRIGRSVRDGEIPRKFVKGRAVTINSKRREELIKLDGGEVDDQALFSEDQTEIYVPDPVVDGKVPKNSFGNIDLFVDTMLPEGAVHLPSKLAVKCAKLLQIDYAEAIVGFEFRQRRATPTMSGIVVAAEHADTLRRAIENLEQQTLEKTLAQQQDRVLKRWKKLIVGLRIRQRLQGQFKDVESGIVGDAANQSASTSASAVGTPRRDVSLPGSPARSDDDSISRRSAGTIGSSKRKRSSRIHRSPPPSNSLSASTDSEGPRQRSPPRKRVAPARTTRSNAATATARDQLGSELPTSVPVRTANGRPTRASALKAKQNFASQAAEESEDFDEQSEGQAEPARTVEEDVPLDRIDDWEPAETGEVGTGDRTATGNLARDLEPVKPSEELPSAAQGGEASVEVGDGHIVHIEDEYGFEYESD